MELTKKQQDILDGKEGEVRAKIMKTLVMYGEAFDATRMADVTSEYNHLVTSVGVGVMTPVFDLMDTLLNEGALSKQKFTMDPRPMDPNVPKSFIQNLVFKHIMYTKQASYEEQLKKLGLLNEDAFTCTAYMPEVGNIPKMGEVLSWSESSAVVYANSVLGARCNRNSGIIDIMGSIAGCVPYFGLLTDEGRKADWIIRIETTRKPEAQLLGSAIGMKVMEDVPYVIGLDKWIGNELNDEACTYLKDFGAATASNGAVGLYHIDDLTPEAKKFGKTLIKENAREYVIDDAELQRVYDSYPIVWKNKDARPKLCFMGCPHMSLQQIKNWTDVIEENLKKYGNPQVLIPTVFTAAPAVIKEFRKSDYYPRLEKTGIILSSICPLMYMNNPLCKSMPVITSSNKLRTYTTSRYYTDEEIVLHLCKGGN
ncbi:MAG: aconitase X catalytic domain-containing protein [Erysipelotrichaceae bacterium]|nr:aconitase X catalytic domain-containing protein [Erysipelotrichaceae bacterium]